MKFSLRTVGLLAVAAVAFAAALVFPSLLLHADTVVGGVMLANAAVGLELKTLVEGIQTAFNAFKTTNDERLTALEKSRSDSDFQAKLAKIQDDLVKLTELKKDVEALEKKANRQGLGGSDRQESGEQVAYRGAFIDGFARKGNEAGLKDLEAKAWSTAVAADGGYALPKVIETEIETLARDLSPMRSLARIVQVSTSDYNKLVNKNGTSSGWVGETAARPATNTSTWDNVKPPMGEVYCNPQISQVSLDDLMFDVEAELMTEISTELAVAEGSAFVTGDGTNKPKGFLAYTTAATADASRAFLTLEHIPTGVAGDFPASNKADFLIDIVSKLKKAYRAGSTWTMGKALMFEIMKFKDTTGQYLWQPSIKDGVVMNLLGYPVVEMEDMPVKAANALAIAFGNFRRGYTIVDRVGMRVLRDPYSNKPYVGFYTTKRVGGAVINSECIKIGKFSVS